ncbi:ABC transporter ATP-binding protein [Candidatus Saccharibacteria bacterium]|nr:ABC transporter ATP-binding protein [Candidatus Saccharibacteria bacterium]
MVAKKNGVTLEQQLLEKYDGDVSKILAALDKLQVSKTKKKRKLSGQVVISLKSVSKTYRIGGEKVDALRDVSLEIQQGEYVALTGPSGSGKSTLLQLIGALDKPSDGVITINNEDIAKLSDRKLSNFRNKTIGFVFQFFYLQPFLNLQRNLEVPGMFARTKKIIRQERTVSLTKSVGLSDRLKHLPNELSGGQMQRAAIARALLNEPKIILADEPTGNLDRENAFAIMDLFDKVREAYGTTVIVVTHDHELAVRADREIRLRDGKIVS